MLNVFIASLILALVAETYRRRVANTKEAALFRILGVTAGRPRCLSCLARCDARFGGKVCVECGTSIGSRTAGYVGSDGILYDEQHQPLMRLGTGDPRD
jgi:hypothetical protein